jgi:hypothetical protein
VKASTLFRRHHVSLWNLGKEKNEKLKSCRGTDVLLTGFLSRILCRWNSAKEDQCQNRIHRFGQEAPIVRVRKFIVNDSVEERIVELQQRKAFVAGEIYSDVGRVGEIDSARLTLEDFRLIFRSC